MYSNKDCTNSFNIIVLFENEGWINNNNNNNIIIIIIIDLYSACSFKFRGALH